MQRHLSQVSVLIEDDADLFLRCCVCMRCRMNFRRWWFFGAETREARGVRRLACSHSKNNNTSPRRPGRGA